MNSTGALGSVDEGALQYIREVLPFAKRPVFLVVSIVNPHDVLFYPSQVRRCTGVCACAGRWHGKGGAPPPPARSADMRAPRPRHLIAPVQYEASGYSPSLLTGPILPPGAANESLATKPFAQQYYQTMVVGNLGPAQNLTQQTNYINFYANLIKQSDEYLVRGAGAAARAVFHAGGGHAGPASRVSAAACAATCGGTAHVHAPTPPPAARPPWPQVNTLNTLDAVGLTDRTIIIRTADHGEMGMAHGTLIQKNFNM